MHSALIALLAAAGGGSGGFGGGGGGGGGGGFSGGGGAGSGGGGSSLIVILIFVVFVLYSLLHGTYLVRRRRRRQRERAAEVERVALAAAEDDADFAPDNVKAKASDLFLAIQDHWSQNDIAGLEKMVGPDLMVEWRRRLADFDRKGWRNKVSPHGPPQVDYVGLTNRAGDAEDRVVVLVSATCEDFVVDRNGNTILKDNATSTTTTVQEYWTLEPPGDRWRLISIEQLGEGDHELDAPMVATPDADQRVSDDALVETQMATALQPGFTVADIAPAELDPDARAAALDLALEDGRFAPDVLEVAVRRAVEAWGEAIDGADDPLTALASTAAVDELLYGGDSSHTTRVVVRGAQVDKVAITALDPHAQPPTMTATIALHGRLYVENRDTTDVVSGNKDSDSTTRQTWTFALSDDRAAELPWRLVAVA
jgi:predicted lipid-binding transport protein (Tim44 family)